MSIWSRWNQFCVYSHPQSPLMTPVLFNSWSAVRSHARLTPQACLPLDPRAALCFILFPDLSATQTQRWWPVRCCSMFSSTFKVPPAVPQRCKNRSTAQRYCFLLPGQFEVKSDLLMLAYPPNFARENRQIVNNRWLIKAICCEHTVIQYMKKALLKCEIALKLQLVLWIRVWFSWLVWKIFCKQGL